MVITLIFLAAPFLPFVFGVDPGEGMAGALLVCGASLGAPGFVGVSWPNASSAAHRVVRGIASAAGLQILAAILLKVLGISPTPTAFAIALGAPTVLLGAFARFRGGRGPTLDRATGIVAAVAFTISFYAATQVVPALEDQDQEVQATAFGLAHELQPIAATNRSTLYWFAHPLLHHAFVASTLVLSHDLDVVRPNFDVSIRSLESLDARDRERGLQAVLRAFREPTKKVDLGVTWFREIYRPFVEQPVLFGTRAPNFLFAAVVAVLLFRWISATTSRADAALVTLVYATLPEVFVRSGYGGYYAGTSALFLASLWLVCSNTPRTTHVLAGFLSALTNQKTAIVAAATVGHRILQGWFERSLLPVKSAWPLAVGVGLGGAAFATYGLALFPSDFVVDHLLDHGFRRFDLEESVTRAGRAVYPSRGELWLEFGDHMGWVWTVLAAVAFAWSWRALRDPIGVVTVWVLLGAIAFTAIDWRQTKHLSLLVPALALLQGRLLGETEGWLRWGTRTLLTASFGFNLWMIFRLSQDFGAIQQSTVW